jgi:hypothetical protein
MSGMSQRFPYVPMFSKNSRLHHATIRGMERVDNIARGEGHGSGSSSGGNVLLPFGIEI